MTVRGQISSIELPLKEFLHKAGIKAAKLGSEIFVLLELLKILNFNFLEQGQRIRPSHLSKKVVDNRKNL